MMEDSEWWVLRVPLRFNPSTLIISFFVLVLAEGALPSDPQPADCEPRQCGQGLEIRYPFWINGQQPSNCGYPGFDVVCKDGATIFKVDGESYVVQKIFYYNNSFIVSSAKSGDGDPCPYPRHNISLARNLFNVSAVNRNLFFYLNCAQRFPGSTGINCAESQQGRFSFVTELPVLSYENASKSCESVLSLPFLADGAIVDVRSNESVLRNGFLVEWTAPNCRECVGSGGRCGYNRGGNEFMCICSDRVSRVSCSAINGARWIQRSKSKTILGVTLGASGLLLACITLCCCHYKKNSSFIPLLAMKSRNSHNVEAFLKQYGSSVPKRYGYSEVKKITRSFSDKLGQGGYGTVFKGKLPDDKLVAVKVLNKSNENGEEFINEVASIGRTHHINIVRLLGFCYERSKRALIYEFMPNGSLEKFIFLKEPKKMAHLGWDKLHEIAIGIARGLEYLHRGCNTRIVHFDIKPHNILLDEDFCPKISDFGLAKSCRPKQSILSTMGARGTIGYIAPEVFSRTFGVISSKSDVYSYGMMVLEMVGGRKNADAGMEHTSEIYFPHWIYEHFNENGVLKLCGTTSETEEIARKMIIVGLWCIQTSPANRPAIDKVVEMLEGNINDLQMPPKPYLSSPESFHIASYS